MVAAAVVLTIFVVVLVAVLILARRTAESRRDDRATDERTATAPSRVRRIRDAGQRAEERVWRYQLSQLPPRWYTPYRSVIVPHVHEPGGTTEIDLLVVSRFGLFVIEVKSGTGRVFAGTDDEDWTIVKRGRTEQLFSPIKQNRLHTRSLAAYLDVPRSTVQSIVCFTGDGSFGGQVPDEVVWDHDLNAHLCGFQDEVLTEAEVTRIIERIEELESTTDPEAAAARHRAWVSRRHGDST